MTFKELSLTRFSARKFTAEPVSPADLDYILECARLAPSACNRQPWRFIIISSEEGKEKIRRCYSREWFATAPLYVLCMKSVDEAWVRPDDKKNHGDVDLGIAVEHLCLAAADRGLGTCWVCNYDTEAVARLFPREGYEAVAIVPIGHIAADCPRPEKRRKELDSTTETV
jgi:nitroreductase